MKIPPPKRLFRLWDTKIYFESLFRDYLERQLEA